MALKSPREIFKGKVHDFLDVIRIISYPLSKQYIEANSLPYDLLIYVEDWKGSFNGADDHWMYLTSNDNIQVMCKWMRSGKYKPFVKKRKVSQYMIIENKTGEIVYKRARLVKK